MGADDYFDDDGFIYYVPTSVDPGYVLLIATIVFCIFSNAVLPCLVVLSRRYEKGHRQKAVTEGVSFDAASEQALNYKDGVNKISAPNGGGDVLDSPKHNEGDNNPPLHHQMHGAGKDSKAGPGPDSTVGHTWRALLDQIMMPPYPDEKNSVICGSACVGESKMVSDSVGAEESRSSVTGTSAKSSSFWDANPLDVGIGINHRRGDMRRQRRILGDKELRRKDHKAELAADRKEYAALYQESDGAHDLVYYVDGDGRGGRSEIASKVSSHYAASRASGIPGRRAVRDVSAISGQSRRRGEGSTISGNQRNRGHSPEPSVLSGLEDHMVSPHDAADADDPGFYILPKPDVDEDPNHDICCGMGALWRPSTIVEGFNSLVHLAEYDHEMKRIIKLCVPYSLTALLSGVVDSAIVAIVSQFIGTDAVAAYTLVQLILGLTSEFLGGILACEATLCSHAVGAGNPRLAGQYVQICMLIFSILMIPNIILWTFFVEDVIILFGFDQELAQLGYDYARIFVFHGWLKGFQVAYTGLLNVIGYENFVATMYLLEGIAAVVGTVLLVLFRDATLQEVALVHLAVGLLFFFLTVAISVCHGRMSKYFSGMVRTAAFLNKQAVRNVLATSLPLAFGTLLEYSEWEILTIFTARLGTAEVAAWGIVGSLWETVEALCRGIADGGEVRCSYHLGNANPGMAKISAYKTMLVSICASFFVSSIIFMIGENLAIIFTSDPTLQNLIVELIPFLGVGNIALTAGCTAWALVGAQARYRLATFIALLSSWGITMPFAAIMTYALNINLQGITSAVVIGYSVTCTALVYVLLRSDWERISKHIVEINDDSEEESSEDSHQSDGKEEECDAQGDA